MNSITNNLINYIASVFNSISKPIAPNIVRGHLRSISTNIEDGIARFISEVLPQKGYKLFLDPSIHVKDKQGKTHLLRPDLLIVKEESAEKRVVAYIEIKSNMGWCRDAHVVITDIINNHELFLDNKTLTCEFSTQKGEVEEVIYDSGVKLYLLSLTGSNCSDTKHDNNKQYASANNVKHYVLFTGWYDSLQPKDVDSFMDDLRSSFLTCTP